jgi:hypothetical protein
MRIVISASHSGVGILGFGRIVPGTGSNTSSGGGGAAFAFTEARFPLVGCVGFFFFAVMGLGCVCLSPASSTLHHNYSRRFSALWRGLKPIMTIVSARTFLGIFRIRPYCRL